MSMVGGEPPADAAAIVFGQIYRVVRPRHLLIPGCGSCAGLDVVDPEVTSRVVGVDSDIQYVAMARQRYRRLGPVLEMYCGDPLRARLQPSADFDLVHLPLLDERLDGLEVCRAVPRWVSPGGVCSLLLAAEGAALARLSDELSLAGLRRAGAWSYGLPGPARGTVALFRAPGQRADGRPAGDDATASAHAAAK